MELGKSILKIRKDNNLTQDDLAEKYFVTRQTISNWETGKSYPDLETIVKISKDFNISLDVLLKENDKMLKEIDNKVKANRKYKSILIYVILLIGIMCFIGYKALMLNKYQYDKRGIDTGLIFNETLTVKLSDYDGKRVSVDNMSLANFFDGYVDTKVESNYKVKYDKEGTVIDFYALSSTEQFINIFSEESLDMAFDSTNGELVKTSDSTRKYFNKHDIKNDIDLLNYIKENYYFNSNILTLTKNIKINYLLNAFTDTRLLSFYNIVLINGDLDGYMINLDTGGVSTIKEIHLIKDDKQYTILLGGNDVTSNDFINKLLSSITFEK